MTKRGSEIRLLRIASLIHDKAIRENKREGQVRIELAERLGIKPPAVHKISTIRRGSYIRPEQLIIMSDFFGCPIDQLINPGFVELIKN